MLNGLQIQVETALVGARAAVRFGNGPLLVSPAMWDLIKHATPAELKLLLETIKVRQLPALPNLRDLSGLPLSVAPPEPPKFSYFHTYCKGLMK